MYFLIALLMIAAVIVACVFADDTSGAILPVTPALSATVVTAHSHR